MGGTKTTLTRGKSMKVLQKQTLTRFIRKQQNTSIESLVSLIEKKFDISAKDKILLVGGAMATLEVPMKRTYSPVYRFTVIEYLDFLMNGQKTEHLSNHMMGIEEKKWGVKKKVTIYELELYEKSSTNRFYEGLISLQLE